MDNIDYVNLMDVAKMNLADKINKASKEYKISKTNTNKQKLIELLNDRNKIFLFDKQIIKKYL